MTSILPAPASLQTLIPSIEVRSLSGDALCTSIGGALNSAFEDFRQVGENFATLQTIFAGDEMQLLTRTIAQVRGTVAGLTSGLASECDRIDALVRLNDDLAMRLELIRRAVRTISAMATNSRVEAASIDSRVGEISSFAQELVALAVRAQASIDGCCAEQAGLFAMLKASRRILVDFKRTQSGDLAVVERDLAGVGTSIEAHRSRLESSAAELAERAEHITTAIGTIVMSLQIGDSTRQRLEHAIDGLEDVARLYPDRAEAGAATGPACRLAVRQIAGARDEFGRAIGQVTGSLRTLADGAEEIVGAAHDVAQTGRGKSHSFLDEIGGRLGTALQLSQNAGTARLAVDGAIAEIIRNTAKLEGQMGVLTDITESMTMIGINAVLKAKRAGHVGLGLGVIADQLRSAATRVVTEVNQVTPAIGSAVSETQALAELFSKGQADLMQQDNARARQALAAFASRDADIRRALHTLIEAGTRVARELGAVASQGASGEATDGMDALCAALDGLAGAAPKTPSDVDLGRLEAAVATHYTMAAERQIHVAFWDAEPRPLAAIAA